MLLLGDGIGNRISRFVVVVLANLAGRLTIVFLNELRNSEAGGRTNAQFDELYIRHSIS